MSINSESLNQCYDIILSQVQICLCQEGQKKKKRRRPDIVEGNDSSHVCLLHPRESYLNVIKGVI